MPENSFLVSNNHISSRLGWEQPVGCQSRLGDCGLIDRVIQVGLLASKYVSADYKLKNRVT